MSKILGTVRDWVAPFSSLFFPDRCAGCQRLLPPGRVWCSDCWTELAHSLSKTYCPTCCIALGPHQELDPRGRCPSCKKERNKIPLNGICRLGGYENPLSRAIIRFKYHHGIQIGNLLGDMMGQVLMEQEWFPAVEALCPVPIHWTRRLTRGFNQAYILANRISGLTGLPVIELLRRVRPTVNQVGLSAPARTENLKDAFAAKTGWPLGGTSICLIDDVMTTGSTLFEAARTLRNSGTIKTYAAVLAKADQIGDF